MSIKFYDHTVEVQGVIESTAMAVLEEVCGDIESQTKQNTKVKTGQTKRSWRHRVARSGDDFEGVVGSDYMNAVYEEFGTGEYALEGNGRKGGWHYKDADDEWHFTRGKRPRRPFWHAYTTLKPKMIQYMQSKFKEGLK